MPISDHYGIYGTRPGIITRNLKQDHLWIEFRDYKAFSATQFVTDIEAAPWNLLDLFHDFDDKLDTLNQLLYNLLDEHTSKRKKRVRKDSYPWINSHFIEALCHKSYALQLFHRNKSELTCGFYKSARNKATKLIREPKRKYFSSAIQNNKEDPKKFWKILKQILPSKRTTTPQSIIFDEGKLTSNIDISNSF